MTEQIRDRKKKLGSGADPDEPIYDCINRMSGLKPGEEATFFPVFIAELSNTAPIASYNSSCFGTFDLAYTLLSETQF